MSPFEAIYGLNPNCPLDLVPLPTLDRFSEDAHDMAEHIKKIHKQVRKKLEQSDKQYKEMADKHRRHVEFKEGDLLWINMRKERFPRGKHVKLHDRANGPFPILERIGENANIIELLGDMNVSTFFNVLDLQTYHDEEDKRSNSRTSPFKLGVFDVGTSSEEEGSKVTLLQICHLTRIKGLMAVHGRLQGETLGGHHISRITFHEIFPS